MSLTPELRTHFGAPEDRGVLVARVEPGSPAASAGLAVGDVIVAVHDQKVDDAGDVVTILARLDKGDRAKVDLVRNGTSRAVDATLADPPAPAWFRWLGPFDSPPQSATPADGSTWLLDWLRPLGLPKPDRS